MLVAAFNQEKALVGALVGAFSVLTNLCLKLYSASESVLMILDCDGLMVTPHNLIVLHFLSP